jgi:hypothetical protein
VTLVVLTRNHTTHPTRNTLSLCPLCDHTLPHKMDGRITLMSSLQPLGTASIDMGLEMTRVQIQMDYMIRRTRPTIEPSLVAFLVFSVFRIRITDT